MLGGGWVAIRIITGIALLLGTSTLVLTMAGLFGVLSALVLRRSREIGIRKAMGADNRAIRRMVIRDGARPVAAGTIVGLFLGVLVGFVLRASIPAAVQPFPAIAALMVSLTVVPATLAACYFPARRAMRMDPNVTLKDG
jgi:ABC-type antimicrobial peptide transport system permease subunit